MNSQLLTRSRACLLAVAGAALIFLPQAAGATTYFFDSGTVVITATLDDPANTPVLEPGTSPLNLTLGGDFVEVDFGIGTNGAIVDLKLQPDADFDINLDQTVVGLDIVNITGAMLTEAVGAQGLLDGGGDFFLDTEMSATVTGVGGPPPPSPISADTSGAVGTAVFLPGQLTLGLIGVNLATFSALTPGVPDINVKADFTFIGTVPEPGTALLLGLGLAGLASTGPRRRA